MYIFRALSGFSRTSKWLDTVNLSISSVFNWPSREQTGGRGEVQ
uniref:Uncharacterized protein n=1 Tax=Anguilla anguilla TaxID=7936 RepID=A0A0E9VAY2_ANGAN